MKCYGSVFLILCCIVSFGCPRGQESRVYNFIINFDDGKIVPKEVRGTPTGKPVFKMKGFQVGEEKRDVIVTLAGSRIEFQVKKILENSKLIFGIGMDVKIGDGAEGVLTVETEGGSEIIFQKYVNPIDKVDDKKWFDEIIDLSKYKGKKVKIIFEAKPGPKGDATGDWFTWSNPELRF